MEQVGLSAMVPYSACMARTRTSSGSLHEWHERWHCTFMKPALRLHSPVNAHMRQLSL